MAAARFAGLSRVLLRAQIRHLQTLVFVGSTNAKGDSSLLATLFADEDSKLGRVITEEVMRMRLRFSHPRDEPGSSGSSMDLQPKLEAEDPLTSSKDGLDGVTPVQVQSGCRIDKEEFNRLRNIYAQKLIADAAEARRRDEVNAAEALARFRANHRFDRLENLLKDGLKALGGEIAPLKRDVSQMKEVTAKGLNEQTDAIKGYTDKLKEQEKLKKEAEVKSDKLWVYDIIDRSVKKLPWGLPGLVQDVRSLWDNASALYPVYPVAAATFLYVRNSVTPDEYLQILMWHHDSIIAPYLEKLGKLGK